MKVEELDKLCEEFITLREKKDAAKKVLESMEDSFKAKQAEVITALQALDKSENEGAFGKVKIVQTEYYKMVDRENALNWLKETGEYDNLVSVNARTFSSHVKGIIEQKREAGDFVWMPPGVEDSTSDYTYLRVSK